MTFSHIVTAFFTAYLASERGLAANTVASYSDVMKLLIRFACERFRVEPEKLAIEQLDRDLIVAFLDHLLFGSGVNGCAQHSQAKISLGMTVSGC